MKRSIVFLILSALFLAGAAARTFGDVTDGKSGGEASPFTLRDADAETVALFDGDRPVWEYVYRQKVNEAAPKDDPRRTAASYFHPLFGLDGETLTSNSTLDDNHTHHHGLWSSFTTVVVHRPGGDELYDTWTDNTALKKNFIRWLPAEAPDARHFTMAVENGWFLGGESVMNETLSVTTSAIIDDERLGRYRTLDFSWTWRPTNVPVTLAGDRAARKNFSSMAIRFARPKANPVIVSDNGEIAGDEMLGNIEWLDYHSTAGETDSPFGAAIFPSPNNPPAPSFGMAIRHYGLIAAGWPGLEGVTVKSDSPVTLSYRVVIHQRPWTVEQLRAMYGAYRTLQASAPK